jgi:heat shock protein HslJ
MSGMPHPSTVMVTLAGQELRGCGGNPADLLHGEWQVQNLNGRAIEGGLRGTINFAPGGGISGRSFCNSYAGEYALTGESLAITPGASTLMACVSPAGDLEKSFMNLLGSVRRFEISANGSLILHTSDGRTLTARRA